VSLEIVRRGTDRETHQYASFLLFLFLYVLKIIFTVFVSLHSEDVQALCRPYYEYIGHVLYCTSNAVISSLHMEHTVSAPRCGTLVIIDSFCCILHSFTLRKVESVSETEGGGGVEGVDKKWHLAFLYNLESRMKTISM